MFGDDVYKCPKTVISREYSSECHEGVEPFYTVNDNRNNSLFLKYKSLADQEKSVTFGGRLAEYKYYDMAPIIEKVMGF
jgi:UDP-galactopyranose mutase